MLISRIIRQIGLVLTIMAIYTMKSCRLATRCLFIFLSTELVAYSQPNPLVTEYPQPDSVEISHLLAKVSVGGFQSRKPLEAGLRSSLGTISLNASGQQKSVAFTFPVGAQVVAKGINVQESGKGELSWKFAWKPNTTYQLMLIVALSDTTAKKMLYSGYLFLPDENKWKLIGSCLLDGQRTTLKNPATFTSVNHKADSAARFSAVWLRRTNRSWKNLLSTAVPAPVITFRDAAYVDSDEQYKREQEQIENAIVEGKSEKLTYKDGVYYAVMREGTGKQVSLTDSIVVFLNGYQFHNKALFMQQLDKPATYPLSKLIKGFQLGLPLCRVGSKIKLVIPSLYAYNIATSSSWFYPNSTLVFEVELLDAKPATN
jgi:FKBP-type peptidyl-prolyl cis-trans isomerase